tara:strand:+ start:16967 stop:17731 length:765 start_codon:yes stop_codon:yes gene_type:complete
MAVGAEGPMKHLLSVLKAANCRVIYDADDNPHAHFASSKVDPLLIAKHADVNTVSVPALKRKIRKAQVLPNCLDLSLWERKPRPDRPVTIGLTGGASHYSDWRQVTEPLERLQAKYDIRIVVGGYFPGYLRKLDVEHIKWKPYWEYPDTIREMDILLCPLDDDEFNRYKSAIKAIEGMAVGAVPVCSNHPVYQEVITPGENGVLVENEWEEALGKLIQDTRLRERLSGAGWDWVCQHRDMDTAIQRWITVYGGR